MGHNPGEEQHSHHGHLALLKFYNFTLNQTLPTAAGHKKKEHPELEL